ncbi:MAG TPA: hypothetical protein VF595_09585 [Tepidisphaeraceae bacterium]
MTQALLALWALLIAVVGVLRPRWLVPTAIIMSVFEGAALFKAGGFGVSPYYLTLILIALRCVVVPTSLSTLFGPTPAARRAVGTAMVFAGVCVAGAVVLPRVFAGMPVLSPRLSEAGTASLSFSNSNIGQAVYLLLNVALLWYVAHPPQSAEAARSATTAVMTAGIVVVGLALYQIAAAFTGLPFPDDLLYSNDGYVIQNGTVVLNMPRISSTFTEPAGMAVFGVAFVALLTGPSNWAGRMAAARVPLLAATVAVMLLSTSSTAYVGLAAVGAWRLGAALVIPILQGRPNFKSIVAAIAGVVVVCGVIAVTPALQDLLRTMVLEKDQSSSYDERSGANTHSWQLALDTLGLGTGLGSNRASSLLPSLLSTTGVAGLVLLTALVVVLLRRPINPFWRPAHAAMSSALIGILIAKLLSSPDLSTPSLWAVMAALLATHVVAPAAVPQIEMIVEAEVPEAPRPRRRFVESSLSPTTSGAGV